MVTAMVVSRIRTASTLYGARESIINTTTAACLSKTQGAKLHELTLALDEIISEIVPNTAPKED